MSVLRSTPQLHTVNHSIGGTLSCMDGRRPPEARQLSTEMRCAGRHSARNSYIVSWTPCLCMASALGGLPPDAQAQSFALHSHTCLQPGCPSSSVLIHATNATIGSTLQTFRTCAALGNS
jgi:hypothetical protein